MPFDYSVLRGKIRERLGSESVLADRLGMSRSTMSLKLNGKAEWSQQEMFKVIEVLGEPTSALDRLFFKVKS